MSIVEAKSFMLLVVLTRISVASVNHEHNTGSLDLSDVSNPFPDASLLQLGTGSDLQGFSLSVFPLHLRIMPAALDQAKAHFNIISFQIFL